MCFNHTSYHQAINCHKQAYLKILTSWSFLCMMSSQLCVCAPPTTKTSTIMLEYRILTDSSVYCIKYYILYYFILYIYIYIYIYTGCFKKSFTTIIFWGKPRCVLLHFDSSKRCVCPLYKFLYTFTTFWTVKM
jgi:hypothetical protein